MTLAVTVILKTSGLHIDRVNIVVLECILSLKAVGYKIVERYRSGHNEAVLKTVCPKGRVGSNPTLSAQRKFLVQELPLITR